VILRVVSGRIRPGELDAVSRSFRADYVPVAARTPGLRRYVVAARIADDGPRIAAMSIWRDVEAALTAYGGDVTTPRTLDGRDHGATFDRVDYYELEAVRMLADARMPARLRLSAGTIARGLDADIQQELRARLSDLPPDALEAYVGRRVLGGAVDIAFMSTWAADPPAIALDAPLWPEISDRYSTFRLEVHEVVVAGSGPAIGGGAEG
jgi:hypothetical protein